MQNKPQMVEAVMFITARGVSKQMFFTEFEALLDGVVNMPEYADQQMRMAYVLINPRLLIKSVVLFYLDFDEKGCPDSGWNIPLQTLAARAERGPDLGAGPIRLACHSQCPQAAQQMHLWDAQADELVQLREAVKRNSLALLVEEEAMPVVALDRLQIAAEDKWYANEASNPEQPSTHEQAVAVSAQAAHQQRLKAAQLIKQLRQRNAEQLQQQHTQRLALEQAHSAQVQDLHGQITQLQQALAEQQAVRHALQEQLAAQEKSFKAAREEMSAQLRMFEQDGRDEQASLQAQLQMEMQTQIASVTRLYQEQLSARDAALSERNAELQQAQQLIQQLQADLQSNSQAGAEQALQQLAKLGVVFVVFHPGAGHLTIALQDLPRYQANPMAYAASKCFVSEEQYRQWLEHYQQPACSALLVSGERCAMPLDRIDTPNRFVPHNSNCCPRHQSDKSLRTVV
ncbi:chromosome partitioning protein ParA [Pseudomonas sp. 5P_3.1_Bac2]|uniref:chromosome partitioning protein ParA n=1 Tax=Pseudomonas sp. 5P_3.1_Bac2 TaxID=2971617 RepID=UPI0021CA2342|nr:chromosome partitioning protein ParA [Pseudomonas sp. 5P_3.1_Bac2]MCU1716035.1 chromosome partitioning protein ParA [Pseudomonas sp. 5P_3.1_Bac2]